MPFFKSAPKSPQEVIKAMRDAIQVLSTEEAGKKSEKAAEEVSKHLQAIKGMLYGSAEQEPQPDVVATLAHELYSSDVLVHLVDNLQKLDFEVCSTLIMFFLSKRCHLLKVLS